MLTKAPSGTTAIRRYAIRRVNPFLGVMQVLETARARAISTNGVTWNIEVRAERPAGWGSLNRGRGEPAYLRYGLWSSQDGLVHWPMSLHHSDPALTGSCEELIEAVQGHLGQLPFVLTDRRELWLFDSEDRAPLALLASAAVGGTRQPSAEPKRWSASFGTEGLPSQGRFPAATELEELVRRRAGFNVCRHWVLRQPDGSGVSETRAKPLAAAEFPPYLLTEDWPDARAAELVRGYFAWIAPALLTLQDLSSEERARMERCLSVQAVSVEHHWHLYPEIIDAATLRAARVQNRLHQAYPGRATAPPD
jgi:hypothetical protein